MKIHETFRTSAKMLRSHYIFLFLDLKPVEFKSFYTAITVMSEDFIVFFFFSQNLNIIGFTIFFVIILIE